MSHAPATPQHTHCQNCATPLQGPFCHRCGQHDFDVNQSFGHVFLEALENFFHFDAKLFRNIVTLLFRPGRLSAEFNAGKRVTQMPPFRLYVFVSVLFFLISFISPELQSPVRISRKSDAVGAAAKAEPAAKQATKTPALAPKSAAGKASAAGDSWFEEKALHALEHQGELEHLFIVVLPKLLLLCLPFFALLTWLLFRRAAPAYLQHLVVALHFHSFVFLWRLIGNGWIFLVAFASPVAARFLGLGVNLWLLLYPVLMLRHLFGNPWPRTLLKSAVLVVGYLAFLGLGFLGTAIALFFVV